MSRRMISNQMWEKVEPLLPPYRTGRPPIDNRNFMEALLWIARTGEHHGETYQKILDLGKPYTIGSIDGQK